MIEYGGVFTLLDFALSSVDYVEVFKTKQAEKKSLLHQEQL